MAGKKAVKIEVKKKDGPFKNFDEKGKLAEEGTLKNGELEGLYKEYDVNGKLVEEAVYKSGLKDGLLKAYYENGKVEHEIDHKRGIPNGMCKFYDPKGILREEGFYKNGLKEGVYKFYDEKGLLSREAIFKNGSELPSKNLLKQTSKKVSSKVLTKTQIRQYLLDDLVLRMCAGPERLQQVKFMPAVFNFLRDLKLKHPFFPQSIDSKELEKFYIDPGSDAQKTIASVGKKIEGGLKKFNKDQYGAFCEIVCKDQSIILAFLLISGAYASMEYSVALLASQCLIPGFSDINEKTYEHDKVRLMIDTEDILEKFSLPLFPSRKES